MQSKKINGGIQNTRAQECSGAREARVIKNFSNVCRKLKSGVDSYYMGQQCLASKCAN